MSGDGWEHEVAQDVASKVEGPTIYAELMDFSLADPRMTVRAKLNRQLGDVADEMATELTEQLRKAYTAGVADGYRHAIATRTPDTQEDA